MSQSGEVIVENFENIARKNIEEKIDPCSLYHETKTPPNYKAKTFHVGDGNVIGKSAIQEFFDCTGAMPMNKRSILLNANCYADAIVMLVDKIERKFVHIHAALQKVF